MSLLNLIVQPDCAYVITDSGHYDLARGGAVTRLGPKSMVLEKQRLVIACAGSIQCAHLSKSALAYADLSQAEFLAELPGVAREAVDQHKVAADSTVVFAGWSEELGCAFGGGFMTHTHGRPASELHYRVMPKKVLLLPPVPDIPLAPLTRPTAFNPFTNSLPIIEQQRRFDFSSPGCSVGCCIAGDIDIVSVSDAGFSIETIHTYPAVVGELVRVMN